MRNSQDIPPKCIDPKYLKQSCKKEYIYIYIKRERERERERVFNCLCGQNIDRMEERDKYLQ